VLGFVHHQGALYVHLAGPEPALIVLGVRPPRTPYLVQASHRVTAWSREAGRVAVSLSGVGPKLVELAGLPADRDMPVEIREGSGSRRERARTGPDGHLTVRAGEATDVEMRLG
jgi:hypothetical protein